MFRVLGSAVTPDVEGCVDQDGYEILHVIPTPLIAGGASLSVRHTETGKPQLWDLQPGDILWLRETNPYIVPADRPPAAWVNVAHRAADVVLRADSGQASA